LSKALVDPMWYFLLFWLPLYSRDVLGLDMGQIGWALPCVYFTIPGDVLPIGALGSALGFGSFAGTVSSVAFSAILPGYLIPILGNKPLILILSFGHVVAVMVIHLSFGDSRPEERKTASS
jgi:hypothetical protein